MMTETDETRTDRVDAADTDTSGAGAAPADGEGGGAGAGGDDPRVRTDPTEDAGDGGARRDDAQPVDAADRRNLGALAHLSAFVGLAGVPSFLGPLAVWLLHRERDPWVAGQARDALNFNLSLLIYAAAAVALSIVTLGVGLLVTIPAVIAGAIAWLVVPVIAALRAADGGRYRYPFTLELVR